VGVRITYPNNWRGSWELKRDEHVPHNILFLYGPVHARSSIVRECTEPRPETDTKSNLRHIKNIFFFFLASKFAKVLIAT
jgi:hypothetical protein